MAISFLTAVGCSQKVTDRLAKQGELERLLKTHDFIPFNIPRDGDGVGTLITFDKGQEAVVAAIEECFDQSELNIKKLNASISNYDYVIEAIDTSSLNPGQIFGENVTLNSILKGSKVKKIKVEFNNLFEQRVSRQSIQEQLNKIKEQNLTCLKNITNERNFLIERVLGAGGMTISLVDEKDRTVDFDSEILKEINIDSKYVRDFNGNSVLAFNSPRYIGYRIWQVEAEGGMGTPEIAIRDLSNEQILKMKEK